MPGGGQGSLRELGGAWVCLGVHGCAWGHKTSRAPFRSPWWYTAPPERHLGPFTSLWRHTAPPERHLGPLYVARVAHCGTGVSRGSPLRGSGDALCHWSVTWVPFTRLWRRTVPLERHVGPPYKALATHCGTGVSLGSPLQGSGDALWHRSVTWVPFTRLWRRTAPPERHLGPLYVARVTHCATRVSLGSPLRGSGDALRHRSVTWVRFMRLGRHNAPPERHLGPPYVARVTHCTTRVSLGSPLRGSGDALHHQSATWVPFPRLG
ncbi:hypothetical protein NDU88_000063 [Pleurodeles waltl]|uniref:Secreted protein n=1 Tax=Pleurodeles waltl TaxID=8319 RepID=A0AAV7L5S0_PLEWA|nr:hypothetical protein NDU88_000063 [Pleurodeles waltl]